MHHIKWNNSFHKYIKTSKMTLYKTCEKLDDLGLYRGQPPMLFALWEKDGQSGRELCEMLGIQPSTVAKMVKRLKNTGFITTMSDAKDSRISRVYLTDKGRAVEEDVKEIYAELNESIFKGFDKEQVQLLEGFLDKMQRNILDMNKVESGENDD
jgi:DNA-binding MarR family transcriptional regulator